MTEGVHFDAASNYSLVRLADLVTEAFRGYALPVYESAPRLARLIRVQSLDLSLSVVLRAGDERLVGLSFLGLRSHRAWISAFGVVPAFRGRGLGRSLLERLIEQARSAGAFDIRLEVLDSNAPARHLYTQAGFRPDRELVSLERVPWSPPIQPGEGWLTESIGVEEAVRQAEALARTPACWQREACSLLTGSGEALAVHAGGRLTGTALHSSREGAIALHHVACTGDEPGQVVGAVVAYLAGRGANAGKHITLLNEPEPGGLVSALQAHGFRPTMRQLELRLDL